MKYSDDFILLELAFISGRPKETRLALLKELNARIVAGAGISPDDLMIQLSEFPGENFSFGQGLANARSSHRNPEDSHDKNRGTNMRAMQADEFSGYERLRLVDLPRPAASDGKVLLRMTAAGVTPLDHTILSGQFPSRRRARPGQRRSGRGGRGRRNGLSCRCTRDVHRAVWRPRGRSLQRVARRTEGESLSDTSGS